MPRQRRLRKPRRHRRRSYTYWILAEGAANDFFDEDIAIGNPNAQAAPVRITLLPQASAAIVVPTFNVAATSRYTFRVKDFLPAAARGAVGAVVESLDARPLVVERTMTWSYGQRRGGHNSPGVLAVKPEWYLAEGVTGFFETFILITNPDPARDAQVQVSYLRELSGPLNQSLVVPKNGRVTIYVNAGLDLNGNDGVPDTFIHEPFSTVVRSTNGVDIAVERAMYWNHFEGGHESTAVDAPAATWLFAEGNTGGTSAFSWETYLLLANPGDTDANVTLTFFRETGGPLTYQTVVGARRRKTIQVGALDIDDNGTPDLPSASFSTRVVSTNNVPIVAERAMYWSSNGITYIEGHDTAGATAEAQKWAFAEGGEAAIDATGIRYKSFFLVSNAAATPLALKATFVREDGTGIVRTFDVPAQSRFTLPTSAIPELYGQRFATFLESTGAPFTAERAVYWGDGFYGGHASLGTPWDAAIGAPAAVSLAPAITSVAPNAGPLEGGTSVTIRGTNFVEPLTGAGSGTRVQFGGKDAPQITIVDSTTLIAVTPPTASAGAVEVRVSNAHLNAAWPAAALADGFAYTRRDPFLSKELTLAIGDSITFGTSSRFCDTGGTPFVCSTEITGYPQRTRDLLRQRYPAQGGIDVTNAGSRSECVARSGCTGISGGRRLLDLLPEPHQLVVILEGVNDVNVGVQPNEIIAALRGMIVASRDARQVGRALDADTGQGARELPERSTRLLENVALRHRRRQPGDRRAGRRAARAAGRHVRRVRRRHGGARLQRLVLVSRPAQSRRIAPQRRRLSADGRGHLERHHRSIRTAIER